jgi:hypothetical protein
VIFFFLPPPPSAPVDPSGRAPLTGGAMASGEVPERG